MNGFISLLTLRTQSLVMLVHYFYFLFFLNYIMTKNLFYSLFLVESVKFLVHL